MKKDKKEGVELKEMESQAKQPLLSQGSSQKKQGTKQKKESSSSSDSSEDDKKKKKTQLQQQNKKNDPKLSSTKSAGGNKKSLNPDDQKESTGGIGGPAINNSSSSKGQINQRPSGNNQMPPFQPPQQIQSSPQANSNMNINLDMFGLSTQPPPQPTGNNNMMLNPYVPPQQPGQQQSPSRFDQIADRFDQYNPPMYDPNFPQFMSQQQQNEPKKATKCYEIAHYSFLFNVTTKDVLKRLFKAIFPYFGQRIFQNGNYDLYGPIWIMITLIVEIAIVGFIDYQIDVYKIAEDIKNGIPPPPGYVSTYSLDKVATDAFVMLAYFIFNPLMILLITKYVLFIHDMKFLWIFSIYGYSFTIFMVTIVMIIIPIEWLRWVFLGVSGFTSWFFIIVEVYVIMRDNLQEGWGKFLIVVTYVLGSHAVFLLALKYYFLK